VIAAGQESGPAAAEALETICRCYWYPLYAYARRCGQSAHDAQDLTQEFFRLLLEKGWLRAAHPDKGRLRTFLIMAMKRFMAKEWRRALAQRRGGGLVHLPLETHMAESRYDAASEASLEADQVYDRQWALTLIELTVNRLREEFDKAGRPGDFEVLKTCLTALRGTIDYGELSRRLGGTEGAARVAVHRLRKRFRELYREEIAQTLSPGADVEAEVRHLAGCLA
jgi:RNA polymerase sigma-70 factor (ECF subfamily)